MPRPAVLVFSRSFGFIKHGLLPFFLAKTCQDSLDMGWEGPTYTFSNSVFSSVLLSPLCGYVVFPGPETLRFLRAHWLPPGSQPSPCGPTVSSTRSLSPWSSSSFPCFQKFVFCLLPPIFVVDSDGLCLFSFPITLIEHLGGEGRNGSQLAKT